jgi:hypothetical protein
MEKKIRFDGIYVCYDDLDDPSHSVNLLLFLPDGTVGIIGIKKEKIEEYLHKSIIEKKEKFANWTTYEVEDTLLKMVFTPSLWTSSKYSIDGRILKDGLDLHIVSDENFIDEESEEEYQEITQSYKMFEFTLFQ